MAKKGKSLNKPKKLAATKTLRKAAGGTQMEY